MVRYNPKEWFNLIFAFHKSSAFRRLIWILIMFSIFTTGFVFLELKYKEYFKFFDTLQIHSLVGFVLGLLLVFRTNSAYDRWWEGRKQWGALVNSSRNFALKLDAFLENDQESKNFFAREIGNYCFAMKEHLRGKVDFSELDNADHLKDKGHIPNAIAQGMYAKLNELYKSNKISGEQFFILDKELKAFTDIIGACERIKKTPIPYSYNLFLKKVIFVYVITLPLGLVNEFKYWTIPITTFIFYVFSSIEVLAEEIEDPFGKDYNDLPTDDISKTIKANVKEILD